MSLGEQFINKETEEEKKNLNELIIKKFNNSLNPVIDSEFYKNSQNELMLYLGGLLSDTIYKQQKYYRTKGLLKQISPFTNYITKRKLITIYNACNRLQRGISKKERIKLPKILKEVKLKIDSCQYSDKVSQLDLSLALITGFNLYSRSVWFALNEIFEKKIKKRSSRNSSILNLPNFKNNRSFQFGFNLGMYYFTVEKKQRNTIRTKSLIKKLHSFLKIGNIKSIQILIREINLVVLKLFAFPNKQKQNESKNRVINTFLPGNRYELNIFKYFWNPIVKFRKKEFLLGFGSAFTYYYSFNLKNKEDVFIIEEEPKKKISKKGKIIILEEYYIDEYKKKNFNSISEKIAYLQGILLNSFQNYEKNKLKTSRLIKKFSFLYRNYSLEKFIKFQIEIYHTMLSLWIDNLNKKPDSKYTPILFPRIFFKLVNLLGNLKKNDESDGISILLVQGYETFKKLYKKYNLN